MGGPCGRPVSGRWCRGAAVTGALTLLTACGTRSTGAGAPHVPATRPHPTVTVTVAVKQISGVGTVLVDPSGAPLYTPEQEANGAIACTEACTRVWLPLILPAGGELTAGPDVTGRLGTVTRPDGPRQVTLNGRPLYRFTRGGHGSVGGDGVRDSFGDASFVWHVVTVSVRSSAGTPPPGTATPAPPTTGPSANNPGYGG